MHCDIKDKLNGTVVKKKHLGSLKFSLNDLQHQSVWTSQAHLHSSTSQRSPDVCKTTEAAAAQTL